MPVENRDDKRCVQNTYSFSSPDFASAFASAIERHPSVGSNITRIGRLDVVVDIPFGIPTDALDVVAVKHHVLVTKLVWTATQVRDGDTVSESQSIRPDDEEARLRDTVEPLFPIAFYRILIARKDRQKILGDIYEDLTELRAEGRGVVYCRVFECWQVSKLVAARLSRVVAWLLDQYSRG